eukprot:g46767.t1
MKGKLCFTNLLEFFEDVINNVDNGDPVDMEELDFQKAFDEMLHRRLIQKDVVALEAGQGRFTKLIPGMKGVSYEEQLKRLSLYLLAIRRMREDLIE